MNANQLINMVIRMVTRRMMRVGLKKGIGALGQGKDKGDAQDRTGPDGQKTARRARRALRAGRKIGRF